ERGGDIGDADVDIAADDDVSAVFDAHLSSFIAQLTEAGGTQRSVERVGELLSAVHGKNIARDVDRELHALLSENQGDRLARRRDGVSLALLENASSASTGVRHQRGPSPPFRHPAGGPTCRQ